MRKPVLYVNACVRQESRTRRLAEKLLLKLGQPREEIRLADESFPVVREEFLQKRDRLLSAGDLQDPLFAYARQFAEAETIVIAAPYWDLSFPALLKQYLEQINVVGITFHYTEDGKPVGQCRATRLFYVTTAGGSFVPEEYGFGYVKALARQFYGIQEVRQLIATGLDLDGANVESILQAAENTLSEWPLP